MSVSVKSVGISPVLQTKSVSPKQNSFTISPDNGYDGLSYVEILGTGSVFKQTGS